MVYKPKKKEFSISVEYPVIDTDTDEIFISAAIIFSYDFNGKFIGHQFIMDDDVEIIPFSGYHQSRDPKHNNNIN